MGSSASSQRGSFIPSTMILFEPQVFTHTVWLALYSASIYFIHNALRQICLALMNLRLLTVSSMQWNQLKEINKETFKTDRNEEFIRSILIWIIMCWINWLFAKHRPPSLLFLCLSSFPFSADLPFKMNSHFLNNGFLISERGKVQASDSWQLYSTVPSWFRSVVAS